MMFERLGDLSCWTQSEIRLVFFWPFSLTFTILLFCVWLVRNDIKREDLIIRMVIGLPHFRTQIIQALCKQKITCWKNRKKKQYECQIQDPLLNALIMVGCSSYIPAHMSIVPHGFLNFPLQNVTMSLCQSNQEYARLV